jgi:hypothetical protein
MPKNLKEHNRNIFADAPSPCQEFLPTETLSTLVAIPARAINEPLVSASITRPSPALLDAEKPGTVSQRTLRRGYRPAPLPLCVILDIPGLQR